jgi:signal transduction histidine kinase
MKAPSIRWKLLFPTMALATVAAAVLAGLQHARTKDRLLQQLERSLATKCEEVHSVLRTGASLEDLRSFLEVETTYSSSPHEYFYEFQSGDGAVLLSSQNLDGGHVAAEAAADSSGSNERPHPHHPGENLLVRSEPLAAEFPGCPSARVWVGVSLGPLTSAMRTDLIQSSLAVLGGLLALFAVLWLVVGRTLRRVAAIARHASSITSTNLRERLPVHDGDELDALSSVFNGMLAGLERSLEQMESFTSDAAHQLRTPLTRARGELDLILRDGKGLPEPLRLRLEDTRQELERLSGTCSRLLLLARLDRGALGKDLLVDDVDLSVLVEDIVEQVGPSAAERAVAIRYLPSPAIHVRCSLPLLVEALLNLLDNALRFSPSGKAVEVSLRRTESEVSVIIADQGPGVPESLREKVFRRFFRHATAPGDSGTGLGLAIVRGIARAHGGNVHIETSAWGGSAFIVTLPVSGKALIDFSSGTQTSLNRAV